MTLVKSPSGASQTCSECGTIYDLHWVDLEDRVPPVGDGCPACRHDDDLSPFDVSLEDV